MKFAEIVGKIASGESRRSAVDEALRKPRIKATAVRNDTDDSSPTPSVAVRRPTGKMSQVS